jgi:hypothetical protein
MSHGKHSRSGPGGSGFGALDLIALICILAFIEISYGVYHMSAGDVGLVCLAVGGLFAAWRAR